MTGAVEVIDVELIGLRIHHRHQSEAVEVVTFDRAGLIGFGQQIAGSIVDVLARLATANSLDTIADTVVEKLLVGIAGQPVGNVEGEGPIPFGLQLAFVVVAERNGLAIDGGAGQPVFGRAVSLALRRIDQLGGQDGFVVDGDDCAVAVGIELVIVVDQQSGGCLVPDAGQPVGLVVVIVGGRAVELGNGIQSARCVVDGDGGFCSANRFLQRRCGRRVLRWSLGRGEFFALTPNIRVIEFVAGVS